MFRYIKNLLTKLIKPGYSSSGKKQYLKIYKELFDDPSEVATVTDSLVIHICTNGFQINQAEIIALFKDFGYTTDEFYLILFKLGTLSQLFIDKPDILLKHALEVIPDAFTREQLNRLEQNLEDYFKSHESYIEEEYSRISEEKEDLPVEVTLTEDEKANMMIDKWKQSIQDKKDNNGNS